MNVRWAAPRREREKASPGKTITMIENRPPLLLVSGAPASGKTGLSRRLAAAYTLPLLARDAYKELLFDTLGSPDRTASHTLGVAAYALLYASIDWLLDAGVGVVVDCNFHHGSSEEALTPLVARSRAVLLHCETTLEEYAARHIDRSMRGDRHPGHHDGVMPEDVRANVDAGVFEPLALAIPLLRIDTTQGYTPSLIDIISFVDDALH